MTKRSTALSRMIYVQEPRYRGALAAFRRAMAAADLNLDLEQLDELMQLDALGILDLPMVYERWCLVRLVRVLIDDFGMAPADPGYRKCPHCGEFMIRPDDEDEGSAPSLTPCSSTSPGISPAPAGPGSSVACCAAASRRTPSAACGPRWRRSPCRPMPSQAPAASYGLCREPGLFGPLSPGVGTLLCCGTQSRNLTHL